MDLTTIKAFSFSLALLVSVLSVAARADTTLTLNSSAECYAIGEQVVVTIDMTGATSTIVGGQFFLTYDSDVLEFISMEPGDDGTDPDNPFEFELYECSTQDAPPPPQCTPLIGWIDYAVAVVNPPGEGTADDCTMAVLKFLAVDEACEMGELISFRSHVPPTLLSDDLGTEVIPQLVDLGVITIDGVPPEIECPPDVMQLCGESIHPDDTGYALASDNCGELSLTYSDDNVMGDCTEEVIITRTWTATDACDATSTCDQVIAAVLVDTPLADDHDKNRYISFFPECSPSAMVAFRVKLPDYDDMIVWVDEPDSDNISRAVCEPHFQDNWGTDLIHVGDQQIVPTTQYIVQSILIGEPIGDEGSYSTPPTVINTAEVWTDITGLAIHSPPDGVVGLQDVMAIILFYQGKPTAPPHVSWVDLHDEVPNKVANVGDIVTFVASFQGEAYPYAPPEPCP